MKNIDCEECGGDGYYDEPIRHGGTRKVRCPACYDEDDDPEPEYDKNDND